ncbi:protein HYPER-SENSITIVITY-RELATED 4, partial [Dendrobium catenatum]|uniref:protein HYPER-SENSITIVITY-RELATED 4 n=1 Tax=Dendrobium catenatum TaxID=906689 RepID=UPI0010A04842
MDSQITKPIESMKKYLTTTASIVASAMLARTIVNEYLPKELRTIIFSAFHHRFDWFSTEHTIVIKEAEDLTSNELYDASSTYLQTRISSNIRRLRASKNKEKKSIILSLDDGEELIDDFQGVNYKWQLKIPKENHGRSNVGNPRWDFSSNREVRWFKVTFHKKYKDVTVDSYLPHILEMAKEIKAADRRLKLYMNQNESWKAIDLQHPATFETLAMEADLKKTVLEDLTRFIQRKEYYK